MLPSGPASTNVLCGRWSSAAASGGDLGARSADPHIVLPACSARNCDDGPPSGSPRSSLVGREAGGERLAEQDERAPAAGGRRRSAGRDGRSWPPGRTRRCRVGSRRCASPQTIRWPVWQDARRPRRARRAACRTRTARGAGPRGGWRRTPRWGSPRRRTGAAASRQNAMPSPSGCSGRMSTVTKYVPFVGYTSKPASTQPRQQPVALGLQVGGELGEERVGQRQARRRWPAGTARR